MTERVAIDKVTIEIDHAEFALLTALLTVAESDGVMPDVANGLVLKLLAAGADQGVALDGDGRPWQP